MGWRESMAAEGDDKTGGDAGKSKGGRRLGRIGRGSRDEERRGRDGVKSYHRMWPLAARSATVLAYHFNDRKCAGRIILRNVHGIASSQRMELSSRTRLFLAGPYLQGSISSYSHAL
ncbi:hypothetical protein POUND7_018432 [Theobroma cacao]